MAGERRSEAHYICNISGYDERAPDGIRKKWGHRLHGDVRRRHLQRDCGNSGVRVSTECPLNDIDSSIIGQRRSIVEVTKKRRVAGKKLRTYEGSDKVENILSHMCCHMDPSPEPEFDMGSMEIHFFQWLARHKTIVTNAHSFRQTVRTSSCKRALIVFKSRAEIVLDMSQSKARVPDKQEQMNEVGKR